MFVMKPSFMMCGLKNKSYTVYIMVHCKLSNKQLSVYMAVFTGSEWEVHHIHQDSMNAAWALVRILGSGTLTMYVCMGSSYHCIVACAHLGNGTGRRTVRLAVPLLLTSGLVRYEAVRHSCTVVEGAGLYWLLTVHTHGNFIVLPQWYIRPVASWPAIPFSYIILTQSQPVLPLS